MELIIISEKLWGIGVLSFSEIELCYPARVKVSWDYPRSLAIPRASYSSLVA